MKNAKVYSYLRFSDPRQASGSSADRQIQYAARWAAEHDLALDASLSLRDEGLSAYHQRHVKQGALGVFLDAVTDGRIPTGSVLIVEGLDRLSRAEPIQAQAQLAQIINAGITVVTASDGKEYNRERLKQNPMDLVYSLLVMIRAHEESDTKSKRVKAAVRRQAEAWIAGTFRGRIVNGQDPQWLKWENGSWDIIEERAEAYRIAFRMYLNGNGARPILEHLQANNLKLNNKGLPHQSNFYRILRNPALYGVRVLEIDGTQYELENYYPPLISKQEFDSLQNSVGERVKQRKPSAILPIITGMAMLRCGYCGAAVIGQNMMHRKKNEQGLPQMGHRRLLCSGSSKFGKFACTVRASCSIVPVENAIMEYCSDQINLSSLTNDSDFTSSIRHSLSLKRSELIEEERQLVNITDALADAGSSVPRAFIQKASSIEKNIDKLKQEINSLEFDLANAANKMIAPALAEQWRALVDGVKACEDDPRLAARRLISDTFEQVVIYMNGVSPKSARAKAKSLPPIDLVLIPKGGKPRTLRINRRTGAWLASEDEQ